MSDASLNLPPPIGTPERSKEVSPFEPRQRIRNVPAVASPLDIVQNALKSGNVEMYREAVALFKEMDALAARKAFDNAMADARAEIKPIVRNATGHNSKKYADFAAIARAVDPIISKHGLSYRFRTMQTDKIAVTCILSHRDGHFEESTLVGPADSSGNKNAIQSIGSTLTYLQRYSLVQALGLAASDDDDGQSSEAPAEAAAYEPPPGSITQAQADEIRELLESLNVKRPAFLQWIKQRRIEDVPAERFADCIAKIKQVGKADK
jgi:hypothetical protein